MVVQPSSATVSVPSPARARNAAASAALLVHVSTGPEAPTSLRTLPNGVLEVHLHARPDENLDVLLVDTLSRFLGIMPGQIEVVAGTPSHRGQVVVFYDLTPADLEKRLARRLGPGNTPVIW